MNRRFTFHSQCSSAHARGRVSDTDPARLITTQTLMTDSIPQRSTTAAVCSLGLGLVLLVVMLYPHGVIHWDSDYLRKQSPQ